MRCEACEDQREQDGRVPRCETLAGCRIIDPGPDGARALDIRAALVGLGELIGPTAVLQIKGATFRDIKFVQVIEAEIEAHERRKKDGFSQ